MERAALVDRLLTARDARAVVLSAPAGYGKTTLLLQWAERDERPFAWLTVDRRDNEPATFVRHLAAALSMVEPVRAELSECLAASEPYFSSTVLPLLADAVRGRDIPAVLVIDDLGEISSPGAHAVLATLVAATPSGSQVAVASRLAPPPPLRRLRPQGLLAEMGRADLAMTTDESASLVASLGLDATGPAARRLIERSEGWPACLYLASSAALVGVASPKGGPGAEVAVEQVVDDYLEDEFLTRTDPAVARFLLDTSVLTELSGDLCDALTESVSSAVLLRDLARQSQMVIPLAGRRDAYRYHGLVRDFLRAELERCDRDRFRRLHVRAARFYQAAGDPALAVHHARATGDLRFAGEVVWAEAGPTLGIGRSDVVRFWLEGLDDRQLARSCGLALTAGWIAVQSGDAESFARLLLAAESSIRAEGPEAVATYGPGLDTLRAMSPATDLLEQARILRRAVATAADDSPWLALAHFLLGAVLVLLESTDEGVEHLERGERLAAALGLPGVRAHCLAARGGVLARTHPWLGARLVVEARTIVTAHGMTDIPSISHVLTASALVLAGSGDAERARTEADVALRQASLMRGLVPWFAVQGRLQLARAFLAVHEPAQARILLTEATHLLGPTADSPVLRRLLSETAGRLREAEAADAAGPRPSTLTTAELRVLQYLPTHLTFPQIGAELFISRYTVKSQVAAVYRKLGVASRAEAVERSRRLGLLAPGAGATPGS